MQAHFGKQICKTQKLILYLETLLQLCQKWAPSKVIFSNFQKCCYLGNVPITVSALHLPDENLIFTGVKSLAK